MFCFTKHYARCIAPCLAELNENFKIVPLTRKKKRNILNGTLNKNNDNSKIVPLTGKKSEKKTRNKNLTRVVKNLSALLILHDVKITSSKNK